ncbi:winged helix DNA-binding domain-containing protein [soil metagenome]
MPAKRTGRVLSLRALSRATLARQFLAGRSPMLALEVIRHLAGLQSQVPDPPYIGLGSRMAAFHPSELEQLLIERTAVRLAVMRSTIHLVTADDCLPLRAAVQPAIERGFQSSHGKFLEGVDRRQLERLTRNLLEDGPKTLNDIGRRLEEHFPGREATYLAAAARTEVPLVQLPPRGLWRTAGVSLHTPADVWLDRQNVDDANLDSLVRRYLVAYGPASVKDIQTWSGLTRLNGIVNGMRDRLVTYQDETGRELFDLPDQPLPDPDMPAPVRFLPGWDNALLSYASQARILPPEYKPRIFTKNGIVRASLLVDGYVAGIWMASCAGSSATMSIETFRPLDRPAKKAATAEGIQLLAILQPKASVHDVVFSQ